MPIYLIEFKSQEERINLFDFFQENGFVIYRDRSSEERADLKTRIYDNFYETPTRYLYGLIDTTYGNLKIWQKFDTRDGWRLLDRKSPPKVFFDLVREFKKNLGFESWEKVKLGGRYIEEKEED